MDNLHGPEVAIVYAHGPVKERADAIDPRIPVRDDDALRSCRRAARVVDGNRIGLVDARSMELLAAAREQQVVFEPSRAAAAIQHHEMLDAGQAISNGVHRIHDVGMYADDLRAAVFEQVCEVSWPKSVVE